MNATFRVAPYSVTAWIWTVTFIAGLFYFLMRIVITGAADLSDMGFALLLGVMIVFAFLRSVRAYIVTDSEIQVVRSGPGRIGVNRADISSVEASPDIGAFFNVNLIGTGGLFGWAGKARVRHPTDIQSLNAEVLGTNSANSVLMQLKNGRTIILTPADPAAFVAAVQGPQPSASQRGASRRKGGR